MQKRIVINKGKKFIVNVPGWDDSGIYDPPIVAPTLALTSYANPIATFSVVNTNVNSANQTYYVYTNANGAGYTLSEPTNGHLGNVTSFANDVFLEWSDTAPGASVDVKIVLVDNNGMTITSNVVTLII